MNTHTRETFIGAAVVAVLAVFVAYSYGQKGETSGPLQSYDVEAGFGRTDGLYTGADVRVSGLAVGKVAKMELNQHFRATVTLRLPNDVQLPLDTSASIRSDGLMGNKYVELEPGGELDMLTHGDFIEYTQDAVVIEELLTKIVDLAQAQRNATAKQDGDSAQ